MISLTPIFFIFFILIMSRGGRSTWNPRIDLAVLVDVSESEKHENETVPDWKEVIEFCKSLGRVFKTVGQTDTRLALVSFDNDSANVHLDWKNCSNISSYLDALSKIEDNKRASGSSSNIAEAMKKYDCTTDARTNSSNFALIILRARHIKGDAKESTSHMSKNHANEFLIIDIRSNQSKHARDVESIFGPDISLRIESLDENTLEEVVAKIKMLECQRRVKGNATCYFENVDRKKCLVDNSSDPYYRQGETYGENCSHVVSDFPDCEEIKCERTCNESWPWNKTECGRKDCGTFVVARRSPTFSNPNLFFCDNETRLIHCINCTPRRPVPPSVVKTIVGIRVGVFLALLFATIVMLIVHFASDAANKKVNADLGQGPPKGGSANLTMPKKIAQIVVEKPT